MVLRLIEIPIKLYIGDLDWEKKKRQKILINVEICVSGRSRPLQSFERGARLQVAAIRRPDYWEISRDLARTFSGSRYEWVEDLAKDMASHLRKVFNVRGRLTLSKFPPLPDSPRVFQVERPF